MSGNKRHLRVVTDADAVAAKKAARTIAKVPKLDLIRVTGLPAGRALTVVGFTATERLSQPFAVFVELRPGKPSTFDLAALAESLFGKSVGVTVLPSKSLADAQRHFHGEVAGVHMHDSGGEGAVPHVVLELRPALASLARSADTRPFTDKTVKDIATAVLDENGLAGRYKWHDAPGRELPKREHCWQYRETNLAFVQRLLEEEGYQYWFTFGASGHTLHIGAGPEHLPKATKAPIKLGKIGPDAKEGGAVAYLRRSFSAAPAMYCVTGRSEDGATRMPASATVSGIGVSGTVHDPDGAMTTVSASREESARRLAACSANSRTADGASDIRALSAGTVFSVVERAGKSTTKYRATAVRHEATQNTGIYSNRFDAVPDDAPFSQPRSFAKPTIAGVAAATVAEGPNASGHYRLKFDLDRTATPSGWVPLAREPDRLFLPRTGQRVGVSFSEGDPDRPVIRNLLDPAGRWPFEPGENPLLGGVVTPAHQLLFQSDPAGPWVKLLAAGDFDEVVMHDRHSATAKDRVDAIGGDANWIVGKDAGWSVTGEFATSVSKGYGLEAETIVLRGSKKITLQVGGSFIVISESGITINGKLVQLNPPGASSPGGPRAPNKPPKRELPKPKPKKS